MKIMFHLDGVGGSMDVYENKVVISRKGFSAFMIHGRKGDKTIPIDSIKSIQFRDCTAWTRGYIQLGLQGGVECKGGLTEAASDENSILFSSQNGGQAKKIKEFIEKKIVSRASDAVISCRISAADEILKFKSLLDSGVITKEEFNRQVHELLNND